MCDVAYYFSHLEYVACGEMRRNRSKCVVRVCSWLSEFEVVGECSRSLQSNRQYFNISNCEAVSQRVTQVTCALILTRRRALEQSTPDIRGQRRLRRQHSVLFLGWCKVSPFNGTLCLSCGDTSGGLSSTTGTVLPLRNVRSRRLCFVPRTSFERR